MKFIAKTATLNLPEFFSQSMFKQYRMTTYNKLIKQIKGGCLHKIRNITPHQLRYTIILHEPPKIMEMKTHLTISSVKLPVTSRVNTPYLKCIHMIEKHAYIRGVIHSLTNNANMVV